MAVTLTINNKKYYSSPEEAAMYDPAKENSHCIKAAYSSSLDEAIWRDTVKQQTPSCITYISNEKYYYGSADTAAIFALPTTFLDLADSQPDRIWVAIKHLIVERNFPYNPFLSLELLGIEDNKSVNLSAEEDDDSKPVTVDIGIETFLKLIQPQTDDLSNPLSYDQPVWKYLGIKSGSISPLK
jgi:hypothetical protein